MKKKNFKGRCVKRTIPKCRGVCRTYNDIQYAYADVLAKMADMAEIAEFQCNVPIEVLGEEYTTDFLCVKEGGDMFVRECVSRKKLSFPQTCKLLDASRNFWARRNITDWAIVVEKEEQENGKE